MSIRIVVYSIFQGVIMKVIKPGHIFDIWVGKKVTCQICFGQFKLEESDKRLPNIEPASFACPTQNCNGTLVPDIVNCEGPIDDLDLKPALIQKLKKINLRTLFLLITAKEYELLKKPGFGTVSVFEIKRALMNRGLSLDMTIESAKEVLNLN